MAEITLDDIIKVANDGYDDGFGEDVILSYHLDKNGDFGDTLAKFIVIELSETFDTDDEDADNAYFAAADKMLCAIWQLSDVIDALHEKGHEYDAQEAREQEEVE